MAQCQNTTDFSRSLFRKALETQNDYVRSRRVLIVAHDNAEEVESFKTICVDTPLSASQMRVFDDVFDCQNYICEQESNDPDVQILVFVGGQFVQELIESIHHAESVKLIFILTKPPFNQEERESMKAISKVQYWADKQSDEKTHDCDLTTDVESSLGMHFIDEKATEDATYESIEPKDRSCKQLDQDGFFRCLMLLCLLDAPAFDSDKADLIELLKTDDLATSADIENFRHTYASNKALHFYTRDEFVFGNLNRALRTTNIRHLLPFRCILQDINRQLNERLLDDADGQLIVYRGQRSTIFEVADLLTACRRHSCILLTSFFSTSKDRDVAFGFLKSQPVDLSDQYWSTVLFKITISKDDDSRFFPFADVSSFSKHPGEKEVLLAPGRMLKVNNVDISMENNMRVVTFELSSFSGSNKYVANIYDSFCTLRARNNDDSLLCLAQLLVDFKRLDEAKDLYLRLVSTYDDDDKKKATCYLGLFTVNQMQGNEEEAKEMMQKMTNIQYGTAQLAAAPNYVRIKEPEMDILKDATALLTNLFQQLSHEKPVGELLDYAGSDEYHGAMEQLPQIQYALSVTLIENGMYDVAIFSLQLALDSYGNNQVGQFEPLLKARYYMQLARCYREVKKYENALENYQLALEQGVSLPLAEYCKIVTGHAEVLEKMGDLNAALTKYIEVAEIYQSNPAADGPKERETIEESIKRVTSSLVTFD